MMIDSAQVVKTSRNNASPVEGYPQLDAQTTQPTTVEHQEYKALYLSVTTLISALQFNCLVISYN